MVSSMWKSVVMKCILWRVIKDLIEELLIRAVKKDEHILGVKHSNVQGLLLALYSVAVVENI